MYVYYPHLTDEETEAQLGKPLARGHTAGFNPGLSNPKVCFKPGCSGALQDVLQGNRIALDIRGGENQTNQTRNMTFFKPLIQALMGPETNWAWAGFLGRGTVCILGGVFLHRAWPSPPRHPMHVPTL